MDPFLYLFIGEFIIVIILIIIRCIFKHLDSKKIDKILNTFSELDNTKKYNKVNNKVNNKEEGK